MWISRWKLKIRENLIRHEVRQRVTEEVTANITYKVARKVLLEVMLSEPSLLDNNNLFMLIETIKEEAREIIRKEKARKSRG